MLHSINKHSISLKQCSTTPLLGFHGPNIICVSLYKILYLLQDREILQTRQTSREVYIRVVGQREVAFHNTQSLNFLRKTNLRAAATKAFEEIYILPKSTNEKIDYAPVMKEDCVQRLPIATRPTVLLPSPSFFHLHSTIRTKQASLHVMVSYLLVS